MSNCSYVRDQLLADAAVVALAETFKLLGDETRVRILDAVARAEICVCDIAELLGLSESAVSHQLRLLRGMRVVKSRRDGRHIYYSLDDHHIVKLFEQGLEHVQERAVARLDGDRAARPVPAFAGEPHEPASARLDQAPPARSRPGRDPREP